MKKPIALYFAVMSICLHGSAQISFPLFPTSVHGGSYDDTLLNTSAVLRRAGVRQVNAYKPSSEITKTFENKKVFIKADGHISNVMLCFAKSESEITLCSNDTFQYDALGRITDVVTTDNRNNLYPPYHIKYDSEKEECNGLAQQSYNDSGSTFQYFNTKGQQVRLRRMEKEKEVENTLFYYNPDGLLDSAVNTYLGTLVFKRKKRGKNKIIEMTNSFASYKWVYNGTGQCLSCLIILHKPTQPMPNRIYSETKIEINYYYNLNGTLSQVKNSSSQLPEFTMYYSYQ